MGGITFKVKVIQLFHGYGKKYFIANLAATWIIKILKRININKKNLDDTKRYFITNLTESLGGKFVKIIIIIN